MNTNKNINSIEYKSKNSHTISFIENINTRTHYVLKDRLSDLWNAVINLKDYNKIYKFAKEISFEKELDSFLAELQVKGLIETEHKLNYNNTNYLKYFINKNADNFSLFEKYRKNFLIENNYFYFLYFELTYNCNLNCKHCCNSKDMNKYEITFEDAKKILDEAQELRIGGIVLTGGECTQNKDFLKIVRYIRDKHMELDILTNGQNFYDNKELFNEVVALCPTNIQLSLYSMDPEIHDFITGVKGSHHKTLCVINELVKQNMHVTISCFQMSYNPESYIAVEKFAKSINADFVTECGFIYNKKNKNLEAKLKNDLVQQYYQKSIKKDDIRNFKKDNKFICDAGILEVSINPKLDITPCVYCNYTFGNYKTLSLKELLNKIIPKYKEKFIRKNLDECFKYDYCRFCKYCPIISSFDSGFMKKSSLLCEDAKAYYNAYLKIIKK